MDVKSHLADLLIQIPAGTIKMRDDRIKKEWEEQIDSYMLSKYPITQALYMTIMRVNPSTFKGANLPVETLSWKEAVVFCNKLSSFLQLDAYYIFERESEKITALKEANGFRLPSEAEWQYACQADTTGIRYNDLDKIAWYKSNSAGKTQEVGMKMPNNWGLYDMLGNVWEWCSDVYDETVYGSYRVFRGGGWSDVERSVMATNRRRSHPYSFKIDDLGFRIARNLG